MTTFNIKTGARKAIERICEAYGFTSRLQLSTYLGMSASSLSTRIMRDNFPADLVLLCALETGASIYWLTTGEGARFDQEKSDTLKLPLYRFDNGELKQQTSYIYDKALLPDYNGEIIIISEGNIKYFVEMGEQTISDGRFLIEYSGTKSVKEIIVLPGNKLRIDWGKYPLDCDISDIKLLGKIISTLVSE